MDIQQARPASILLEEKSNENCKEFYQSTHLEHKLHQLIFPYSDESPTAYKDFFNQPSAYRMLFGMVQLVNTYSAEDSTSVYFDMNHEREQVNLLLDCNESQIKSMLKMNREVASDEIKYSGQSNIIKAVFPLLVELARGNSLSASQLAIYTTAHNLRKSNLAATDQRIIDHVDQELMSLRGIGFQITDDHDLLKRVDFSKLQKVGIWKYEDSIPANYME